MAEVRVLPEAWAFVDFDSGRIAAVAGRVADAAGLTVPLRIEVDETTPLGRVQVLSYQPVVIRAESGAFEDPKRPRRLSERAVGDVLGRLLFRVRDRLDPAFGDPPDDADLTLAESTAWDAYAVGRAHRHGFPAQRQRRLYHFRNRHGFTDVADEIFERLWTADGLTWSDLRGACDEARAGRSAVA